LLFPPSSNKNGGKYKRKKSTKAFDKAVKEEINENHRFHVTDKERKSERRMKIWRK
jgi:hypothetical protein